LIETLSFFCFAVSVGKFLILIGKENKKIYIFKRRHGAGCCVSSAQLTRTNAIP
jgi:hypothetical protein